MLHWICTEQPNQTFEGHYMPRRALSPGMHAGLSVIMDVQEREYYCSATESVGFKVCILMMLSEGSINEISSTLGIASPAHFTAGDGRLWICSRPWRGSLCWCQSRGNAFWWVHHQNWYGQEGMLHAVRAPIGILPSLLTPQLLHGMCLKLHRQGRIIQKELFLVVKSESLFL